MAVGRLGAVAAALLVQFAIAAGSPAHSQTPRAYRDGVKAVESEDWTEAQRLMRTAIGERSDERKRYTPHYYLGVALFELGDCDGAVASWQESERQGTLGREELDRVRSGRAVCQSRAEERRRAAAEQAAVAAMERANQAAAELSAAVSSGVDGQWGKGNPSPSSREKEARARLESVRVLVDQSRAARDPDALARAENEAREISEELDALRAEAGRLRSEQAERVGDLRGQLADLEKQAREVLRSMTDLAPYPPQVRRKRSDLESLLQEVDKVEAGADEAYLAGVTSRLKNSLQQARQVTSRPPAVLSAAADSFLAGNHVEVLESLAGFSGDSDRARAHSLLLRSAAGYYLWVEGGELDQELLARAAADAAQCRRIDVKLVPPPSLFSPSFLAFFAAAVESPQTP